MKRNLITKKELEYIQKYLPAMGPFKMRTDGGAWVEKIDRHEAELSIDVAEFKNKYLYLDEKTTIDELKEWTRKMGIEWRREVEK